MGSAEAPAAAVSCVRFLRSTRCSRGSSVAPLVLGHRGERAVGVVAAEIPRFGDAVHDEDQVVVLPLRRLRIADQQQCVTTPRPIDALLISVGINDIKFSQIIKVCGNFDEVENLQVLDIFAPGIILDLFAQASGSDFEDIQWEDIGKMSLDTFLGILDDLGGWAVDFVAGLVSDAVDCDDDLDPIVDLNLATTWSAFDLLDILKGNAAAIVNSIESSEYMYRCTKGYSSRHCESLQRSTRGHGNGLEKGALCILPRIRLISSMT